MFSLLGYTLERLSGMVLYGNASGSAELAIVGHIMQTKGIVFVMLFQQLAEIAR